MPHRRSKVGHANKTFFLHHKQNRYHEKVSPKKPKDLPPTPEEKSLLEAMKKGGPGFYSIQITDKGRIYWRPVEVGWRWVTTNSWLAFLLDVAFGVFAYIIINFGTAFGVWVTKKMLSWMGHDSISPFLDHALALLGDIASACTFFLILIDSLWTRGRNLWIKIKEDISRKEGEK